MGEGTGLPKDNTEVYEIDTPTKTREKMKLNGIFLHMLLDTGSDVTLIPRNFCEKISKLIY